MTDFGCFTFPFYYYYNNLALDAPSILFICDYVSMRTFCYMSFMEESDSFKSEIFDDVSYISKELEANHYDAVIVMCVDRKMYNIMR